MKKPAGIVVFVIGLASSFVAWGEADGFWQRFELRDLFFDFDALRFTAGAVVFVVLVISLIVSSRKSPNVLKEKMTSRVESLPNMLLLWREQK